MVLGKVEKGKQTVAIQGRSQRAPIVDDVRFWQGNLKHGQVVEGTLVKLPGADREGFRLHAKYLKANLPRASKTGYRRLGKK
ncbi:TPA: hypothetical protein HA249_01180 [Candidatus Woesearchaeota archaeon]|nr:MAG: hypothetical protein QT07_C0007G0013 [archaeon GW2011_AR16]HIG95489.1 hypothetical protein [Candidatus Woesearchaeota archaeon]HIH46928.1 hypothetical protein [Candidatus Woesearchaeota archaeon]HII88112.1 hypothetical protein [Candidatus Woesearchaeota archaeon]